VLKARVHYLDTTRYDIKILILRRNPLKLGVSAPNFVFLEANFQTRIYGWGQLPPSPLCRGATDLSRLQRVISILITF